MDAAVLQGIVSRKNRPTGVAEDVLHALALQAFPKNLCSGFRHGIRLPFNESVSSRLTLSPRINAAAFPDPRDSAPRRAECSRSPLRRSPPGCISAEGQDRYS